MRIRFSDLWRWDGIIDRGPYLLIGVTLFILKFAIDFIVATQVFHHDWSIFNYLLMPGEGVQAVARQDQDAWFYGTLLVLALPFIWAGLALTLRRLRAANLPLILLPIFFAPVVNLLFFAVLSILKTQPQEALPAEDTRDHLLPRPIERISRRVVPDNPVTSFFTAILVTVAISLALIWLGVHAFEDYGWAVFVGLPWVQGIMAVLLYGFQRPRDLGSCIGVCMATTTLIGVCLLALAFEGLICLLMAAPIYYVLAFMGGMIGYAIQLRPWGRTEVPGIMFLLILLIPTLMAAEHGSEREPPLLEVTTTVDIDAPPEVVWKHLIAFTELPEPEDWLFRSGIAYPTRAEIHGQGVGAVRHCIFSTGPFVEPIEVWDEPRLLKFSVTSQPCPMKEWSPYTDVHPPHLDNYLVSQRGQFLLTRLDDGGTRLEGTTWYTNKMWPAWYWQLWSDMMIHRIHLRVLDHIKHQAEGDV